MSQSPIIVTPGQPGARVRSAWLVVVSLGLLLAAGAMLHEQGVSRGALGRGCDTGVSLAFLVYVLAGVAMGTARIAADRRRIHQMRTDPSRLWVSAPVPIVLSVLAVPAASGCQWVARLDDLGVASAALLGVPAVATAAAATLALGYSLTTPFRVVEYAPQGLSAPAAEDWS